MPMDSNVNASEEVNERTPIVGSNADRSYMSTTPAQGTFAPPLATMSDMFGTSSHDDEEDNSICFSTPLEWLFIANTCFIVPEKRAVVELFFGGYHGTITKPGFYCRTGIGLEQRWISTDLVTFELGETKVLDARGNPVLISGIVTYYIETARRAAIDVDNPHKFVRDQAPAVLKRIVSNYPYESPSEETASLRTETTEISNLMRDELQMRCSVAGVRIVAFNINELSGTHLCETGDCAGREGNRGGRGDGGGRPHADERREAVGPAEQPAGDSGGREGRDAHAADLVI
ncbi:hypothetical protein FGB62_94g036 [Gracilaria domingensis]|nr:hypothetical protein FGB62_94g036 [Gracilaria domingensis]